MHLLTQSANSHTEMHLSLGTFYPNAAFSLATSLGLDSCGFIPPDGVHVDLNSSMRPDRNPQAGKAVFCHRSVQVFLIIS